MARLIKEVGRNYNTVILPEQLTTVAWASVTGTPTTVAGYGITDAMSGSGTADYVPKFATSTSLGNSLIYSGSDSIGIQTTNISSEANLFLGAKGTDEGGQLVLQKATTWAYAAHIDVYQDKLRFIYGSDTASTGVRMLLGLDNGNLLINSTTDTGERLQVNGNAAFTNYIKSTNSGGTYVSALNTAGGFAKLEISSNATSVATLSFTNSLTLTGGTVKVVSDLVVDTDTLYVDATKNAVGIGKAPISFYSDDRTIQLGYSACLVSSSSIAEDLRIGNNVYFDSSGVPKRIAAGSAAIYSQFFNTHIFQSAASSTAGSTITWTDQMQILDDGTTLIATNSSSGNYKLQVNGNTYTNGEIKTAAPTGGTAENWRLGSAAASSGDTQNTKIEVEIDGVLYYLMAFTV